MNNALSIELIIIAVVAAAVIGIINIFISYERNKENNYINNITSDRIKSHEALRNMVSKYSAMYIMAYSDKEYKKQHYIELLELQNKILLFLNPYDDAEAKMAEQLKECVAAFDEPDADIKAELDKFLEVSREMLGEGLKKSKKETVSSNIRKSVYPLENQGKSAAKLIPSGTMKYGKLLIGINLILLGFIFFKSMGLSIGIGVILFFNGIVYFGFTIGEMFKIVQRE